MSETTDPIAIIPDSCPVCGERTCAVHLRPVSDPPRWFVKATSAMSLLLYGDPAKVDRVACAETIMNTLTAAALQAPAEVSRIEAACQERERHPLRVVDLSKEPRCPTCEQHPIQCICVPRYLDTAPAATSVKLSVTITDEAALVEAAGWATEVDKNGQPTKIEAGPGVAEPATTAALFGRVTDAALRRPGVAKVEPLTAFERLEAAIDAQRAWLNDDDPTAPIPEMHEVVEAFGAWKVAREADPLPNPLLVPLTSYADGLDAVSRQEGCGDATRSKLREAARLVREAANGGEAAPDADEQTQAERWARAACAAVHGTTDCLDLRTPEILATWERAMLPLVREAAADRDKWRRLAEFSEAEADRCRAQRDEAEGLNENERDTAARATAELAEARREIERLRASRDQWMGLAELSGTAIERLARSTTAPVNPPKILDSSAPLTEAALAVVSAWDARAKDGQSVPGGMLLIGNAVERLRNETRLGGGGSTPLTEADHGPLEDEALRWAEDVLDAAKPPEEADLDMSAAARAISPLVRKAQAARRAPLTEASRAVAAALSDHVAADVPMSADECARLRDALLSASRGDIPAEVRAAPLPGVAQPIAAIPRTLTREEAHALLVRGMGHSEDVAAGLLRNARTILAKGHAGDPDMPITELHAPLLHAALRAYVAWLDAQPEGLGPEPGMPKA